jgi:hypothetical protein
MTSNLLVLFLLTISFSASSQTTAKTKDKLKLTYYYVGEGCPFCIDEHPEKEFGFTIKCVGCIMTDTIEKNNKAVTLQLDKKYGQCWTSNYVKTYCDNIQLDSKDKKSKSK